MKRLLSIAVALVFLTLPAAAQTPEALFQQAQRLERTSGDYAEAVRLYERVAEHPGSDRTLVAQAWVRMGRAYENLGRSEARRAYTTVITDFADQEELVAEARDGLSRTTAQVRTVAPATPGARTITAIPAGLQEWGAGLSPQGTYLVGWDHEAQYITLVNRQTGAVIHLRPTLPGDVHKEEGELYAEYLRMSPDETKVAAGWWGAEEFFQEIRITDIEEDDVRVVFNTREYFQERENGKPTRGGAQVHDWSADGKSLLVFSYADEGESQLDTWMSLALVNVDGSGVREILRQDGLAQFGWDKMCLTADNRYVVAQYASPTFTDRHLVKIDVESGEIVPWREQQGTDFDLMACDSTGDGVLYAVNSLGSTTLIRASLRDVTGDKDERVRSITEDYWSILGSRTGDLAYSEGELDNTVYVAGLIRDPEFGIRWGQVMHRPRTARATWSANGNSILGTVPGGAGRYFLWDLENQIEAQRTVAVDSIRLYGLNLTPDPTKAYSGMPTVGEGNSYHSVIIDLETGNVDHFVPFQETHSRGMIMRDAGPTPGELLAWHRESKCLHRFDLDTFETTEWVCLEDPDYQHVILNHAPDYGTYQVLATNAEDNTKTAIFLLDVESETMTKVWEAPEDFQPINQVYHGRRDELFFISAERLPYDNVEHIYHLDLNTGEWKEILEDIHRDYKLKAFMVDPSGTRAIIRGGPRPETQIQELMVVEDLFSSSN